MSQADQQWEILGYDTRRIGKSIAGAWRDLLWGDESPLKIHLDEAVRLQGEGSERFVQSGSDITPTTRACEGILLPDELVLGKSLQVPRAVEVDLPSVMDLEVSANSPFPVGDTRYGWKVSHRNEAQITVQLAMVSVSAVMTYLGRQYDIHEPGARELWADCHGTLLPLKGFGEHERLGRCRGRLIRVGAMVAASAALLLLISATAATGKYLQLRAVEQDAQRIADESREAMKIREQLASANETIAAVNGIVEEFPNPHLELERLTRLLNDEVHVVQWGMRGRAMKLRGKAADAADVMQILTKEPAYAEVHSKQATVRLPDGLEQFTLEITVRGGDSG